MPTFTGTAGDDALTGGEGDDVITGMGGDDVLIGAGGDDILSGGPGRNYLDGGPGNDTVSYLDATIGVAVSLAVTGFQPTGYSTDQLVSIERLIGSTLYGDTLTGGAGNDYLDPGSRALIVQADGSNGYSFFNANDRLSGGAGNDTIYSEGVSNGSIFNGDDGDDVIFVDWSGTRLTSPTFLYRAVDGAPVQVNGGLGADTLTVVGHGVIDGGDGDDIITVGIGATLGSTAYFHGSPIGTDTTVRVTGGAGADTFRIWGPVGTAVITDFEVAIDRLDFARVTTNMFPAMPIIIGQQGDDAVFFTANGTVVARLTNVLATSIPMSAYLNSASVSFATIALYGTSGSDTLTSTDRSVWLYGWDGDDVLSARQSQVLVSVHLDGGAGNDQLTGGRGADTLIGGVGADLLSGGLGDDNLSGGAGDDVMFGGRGSDTFLGGDGFDTVNFSDFGSVTVDLSAGTMTSPFGSGILVSIESVIGSDSSDTLTGSANADTLRGGRGLDQLRGGGGADIFVFAAGDSTGTAIDSIADFQTGSDRIVIEGAVSNGLSLVRTNGGGTLVFAGHLLATQTVIGVNGTIQASDVFGANGEILPANMVGSDGSDVLIGSSVADTINGGGGDDFITGGGGRDVLTGGAGADQFIYLAPGVDEYDRITDFQTGVDLINLNSALPLSIRIDRIGEGRETVVLANSANSSFRIYVQNLVQGNDFLLAGRTNIPLQMNGAGAADWLAGGVADDTIYGGGGADALAGGAGADVFQYRAASDSTASATDNLYDFETGIDTISFTSNPLTAISIIRTDNGSSFVFADSSTGNMVISAAGRAINGSDINYGNGSAIGIYLIGSGGADVLVGSRFADPIQGGAGNDTITGGGGADVLFGEGGADTFVYRAASDSSVAAADTIFGFVSGSDRIDLSAVRTGASDAFGIAYLSGGSFLFVDLGGNGTNDMLIQLAGTTLVASDIRWSASAGEMEPVAKAAGPEVLPVSDDVDGGWTGLVSLDGDGMLFLDDGGAASARGHDWYL